MVAILLADEEYKAGFKVKVRVHERDHAGPAQGYGAKTGFPARKTKPVIDWSQSSLWKDGRNGTGHVAGLQFTMQVFFIDKDRVLL